jgi:hypothetical protein
MMSIQSMWRRSKNFLPTESKIIKCGDPDIKPDLGKMRAFQAPEPVQRFGPVPEGVFNFAAGADAEIGRIPGRTYKASAIFGAHPALSPVDVRVWAYKQSRRLPLHERAAFMRAMEKKEAIRQDCMRTRNRLIPALIVIVPLIAVAGLALVTRTPALDQRPEHSPCVLKGNGGACWYKNDPRFQITR